MSAVMGAVTSNLSPTVPSAFNTRHTPANSYPEISLAVVAIAPFTATISSS